MNHQPEIAIVEANTLTSLGLKGILEEMIPMATIRTFHQFSELMDDTPDMYAHYFISAQIYVEHNAFFLPRKRKTIVLASDSPQFQLSGVPVLNIHESEEELVKHIETPPTRPPQRLSGERHAIHASDAASSGNSIFP